MSARTPEQVHHLFAERFKAGDLDGLVALYEDNAALAIQPGQVLTGKPAIREGVNGFLGMQGQFSMEPRVAVEGIDLALLCSNWTLAITGPDGQPTTLAGCAIDVVRKQPDGTWLIAIDNPWGTG